MDKVRKEEQGQAVIKLLWVSHTHTHLWPSRLCRICLCLVSLEAQEWLRSRSPGFYPIYKTRTRTGAHPYTHTACLPNAPWHPLNASHGRLHEHRHSINKPEARIAGQTMCGSASVCVCLSVEPSHQGTY